MEVIEADEEVDVGGVTIYGPTNIATTVPQHASQMYSKNVATLLGHLVNKEGALKLDMADEITSGVVVTYEGKVVHARVREILGMAPAEAAGDKEA